MRCCYRKKTHVGLTPEVVAFSSTFSKREVQIIVLSPSLATYPGMNFFALL